MYLKPPLREFPFEFCKGFVALKKLKVKLLQDSGKTLTIGPLCAFV